MSEKISPVDGIEHVASVEATPNSEDAGFSHASETSESETALSEESEISHIEGKEAVTKEPPEAIVNVSEVVGIAEEQLAEINTLGEVSRDIHCAQYTLERISVLDPERLKPYEEKFVAERKEYAEQFIVEAKAYKAETVKAGVETIRSLPDGSEIEKTVQLDDAAIIAELTWRKKDKNQPLSQQEERTLKEAFRRREVFFDKLKMLGIDTHSARPLYDHILSDKTLEFQKRLAKESDRTRKIEEAKKYFASQKENTTEEGIFFDPELLAAIEADNIKSEQEEIHEDTKDLQALSDEAFVAQIFSSDDVPNFVSEEMIEALKENKIHVKEGKKLTAFEALQLRRRVLGKRGTETIERMEERAAQRMGQKKEEPDKAEVGVESPVATEAQLSAPISPIIEEVAVTPPLVEVMSSDVAAEEEFAQKASASGSAVVKFGEKTEFIPKEKVQHTDLVSVQEEYFAKVKELRVAMNHADAVNYTEEIDRLEEKEAALTRRYNEQLKELGFEKNEETKIVVEPLVPPEVAQKEHREINHAVAKQFVERFGMDEEDLLGIEGFTELSPNQQLLVLENFASTAAKDISAEGLKSYKENLTKSGLWGRAWKNMTKQYQLGKEKGARSEEWRNGGSGEILAMKKDTLSGLTKLALAQKEFDVMQTEHGLEVEFASPKFFEGKELNFEEQETISRFNDSANRYANLDFSGGDKKQEELRALAEKEYQTALESMTEIYAKHNPVAGVEWQHKVRSAVQMNRFFADNPELEKDLKRSAGMTAFLSGMNTLTERSTIAGAGFGLRVAAVGTFGTLGLFVAAPVVGWTLGARRAKQSIAERDLLARMGERDTSDDAKHKQLETENREGSKHVVNEKDIVKNIIKAETLAKKLTESLRELDEVTDSQMFEVAKRDEDGDFVRDASGKVEKEMVSKKTQLLESLDARIEYTKRKLEEELVNLGATNAERITAINDLMEALGHAETRVALEDPATNDILSERLDNYLDIRGQKIEDNRKHAVRKEAAKGAALAFGFAAAGSGIGWVLRQGLEHFGVVAHTPQPAQGPGEALPGTTKSGTFSQESVGTIKHPSEVPYIGATHEPVIPPQSPEDAEIAEYLSHFNENIKNLLGAGTLRAPLSGEELLALRQTGGLEAVAPNMDAHSALIMAMRDSKIPLSHETIQQIISHGGHVASSSVGAHVLESGAVVPSTAIAHVLESTPKAYMVGNGDTLTSILKQHVSEVRALSSDGQENVIQNFVRSLSAKDLEQIGLAEGPDKLVAGQSLNLERVVQLLHEKQVGGTDILKHAEIFTTPKAGAIEGSALDAHISGAIADTATPQNGAHIPVEAVTTTTGAPTTPHTPSSAVEAAAGGNGTITREAQAHWHNLPEASRLPEAQAYAQQYLEADAAKLYGPPSQFGYWPREWTSLSARGAAQVLNQTKETVTISDAPGYQWSVVSKMQQYIREQGFTKENGFVPRERESIAEFIKRAHEAKIMSEGPTRSLQGK